MEGSRIPELRPLGLGEILDTAFKIYRRHFRSLCLAVLVVVVPLAVISTLVTLSADPSAFDGSADADAAFDETEVGALAATAVLAVLLSTLATAACTRAVAAAYLGRPVDWKASLRFGLRKLLPLVLVSILTGIAVILGLIALILPGIYIAVRLFLASPALVVEDQTATGAMGRSWTLVKDRWWATFGTILVSTLLIFIISAILQGLIVAPVIAGADSGLVGAILNTIGTVVTNTITIPLQAAVLTILYFDLRVRKEGFDLALLSEGVGDPTGPDAVSRSAGLGDEPPPGGFSAPSPEERNRP